jgi:cell division septum initiation protein DivIVA
VLPDPTGATRTQCVEIPGTRETVPSMSVTNRSAAARVIEPDALARDAERESEGFDLKVRGYDREQVEQRIHEWATAYDQVEMERDQLLAELSDLRARPAQLSPLSSMSERVARIVQDAEAEAHETLEAARHEADALLAEAQQQSSDELNAAAQERAIARTESDRLIDSAQAEADRLLSEAQATYSRVVGEASAEAERVRAVLAQEEEQILSGARLEAAELDRTTTRQREIAEAEHQRLLAAHANQQKQYASALRGELEDLEARRAEAEVELGRLRQLVAVPTAQPAPPMSAPPVTWDRPVGTVAAFAEPPVPQDVPVESFLHTDETLLPQPTPTSAGIVDRSAARTKARNAAIDALARKKAAAAAEAETGVLTAMSDETGEQPTL